MSDPIRPDDQLPDDALPDVAAAELGLLLPAVPPPVGDPSRARLLARAAADNAAAGFRRSAPPAGAPRMATGALERRTPAWLTGVGFALAAGLGVTLLIARADTADRDSDRRTFAEADRLRIHALDSLSKRLAEREANFAAVTGARVSVVNVNDARSRKPMGRLFWDQATDHWTFVAHNLPMPPKGRTYQLWLQIADQKVNCGTFMPDARGGVEIHDRYKVLPGTLQMVAVTEEPMGGMPQPTGPMVVLGMAGQ